MTQRSACACEIDMINGDVCNSVKEGRAGCVNGGMVLILHTFYFPVLLIFLHVRNAHRITFVLIKTHHPFLSATCMHMQSKEMKILGTLHSKSQGKEASVELVKIIFA